MRVLAAFGVGLSDEVNGALEDELGVEVVAGVEVAEKVTLVEIRVSSCKGLWPGSGRPLPEAAPWTPCPTLADGWTSLIS